MILILHHDECVARHDLVRDVPGRCGGAGASADFQAGALAERVQSETRDVRRGLARPQSRSVRVGAKMPAQELLERAFADETDAGAVRLVVYRQAGRMRHGANPRLLQSAERKQRPGQRGNRHAVEEIALIFALVSRLQQFRIGAAVANLRIVPGGDPVGSQALHVFQAYPEFDLSITKNIRIWRAARRVLAQE